MPGALNPPRSDFPHLLPPQRRAKLPRLGFRPLLPSADPRGRATRVPRTRSPRGAMATQGLTPPAPEESPLSAGTGCTGSTSSPPAAPTGLGAGRGRRGDGRQPETWPPRRERGLVTPLPRRSAASAPHRKGPDVASAGWSAARPSPCFPPGESRPLIQEKEVDGGKHSRAPAWEDPKAENRAAGPEQRGDICSAGSSAGLPSSR